MKNFDKIIELLNNDSECKKLLDTLNKHAENEGLSADSEEYLKMRDFTIQLCLTINKQAFEIFADDIYDSINQKIENSNTKEVI